MLGGVPDHRSYDPEMRETINALHKAVTALESAVDKLSEGYNLLNSVIFGKLNEASNRMTPGVMDRLETATLRIDSVEKMVRIIMWGGGITALFLLAHDAGLPTDKIGEILSAVAKATTH